jgi:hypothetical protein
MTLTQNPIEIEGVRIAVQEPWRLEPHRLAEYASEGRWKAWPYLRLVSQKIARAIGRGGGRILISMPPRHGKSSLASFWTPIWFLNNFPAERVIMTSHGDLLASDWGRKVRNEFESNELLTTRLSQDSTAANRWNTPEGGGMLSSGVGGGITGFGANLALIDDPHPTWESAMSVTERTKVVDWFKGTLYDRLEPRGTIIVLAHRWHEDDLPGYLIEEHSDQWDVVKFPALAESGDVLGRAEGEALCPERYSSDALNQIKLASGALVWSAKFQQNPLGFGSGRVYDRFEPGAHEDKTLTIRDDLPLDVSFDFNRNPGMHVEIGQYDTKADLFTVVHEIHGPLMKLDAALIATKKLIDGFGKFRWSTLRVFGDATGTQERAETTETAYQQVRSWLAVSGWPHRVYVPASNPPIRDRIDTFNEALRDVDGEVHYKIHPINCPRLRQDLKTLKADEQGLIDKRDLKLSHASDAEGYRLCQLRPLLKGPQLATYSASFFGASKR